MQNVGGDLKLTVYFVRGRKIRQLTNSSSASRLRVDVSELTGGLYFVEVETNSGRHLARFVKK